MANCDGTNRMKASALNLTISDTHFAICACCLSVRILVDELTMDIAGVEIGRGDRHNRRWHRRSNADSRKRNPDEPRRKAVQKKCRHREVVAEFFEPVRVFGEASDPRAIAKKPTRASTPSRNE